MLASSDTYVWTNRAVPPIIWILLSRRRGTLFVVDDLLRRLQDIGDVDLGIGPREVKTDATTDPRTPAGYDGDTLIESPTVSPVNTSRLVHVRAG